MGEVFSFTVPPKLEIEGVVFPEVITPPGSSKTLFLGGAGARGLDIGGKFVKFTAIGVYLEETAVESLAGKWGGKTKEELAENIDFFGEIVAGPFEKFTRVTMILPLTGEQYSDKVSENCVAYWKATGIYTEAEGEAVAKFKETFKTETFPPGSSILFSHSPTGSLSIAFSMDESVPEASKDVIENKALCNAVLESIIGPHGVSPETKISLAKRLSELLKATENTSEVLKETENTSEVKVGNPASVSV